MKSLRYKKYALCLLSTLPLIICSPLAGAEYHSSSSDTGISRLDYIENQRREERENALTERQQKLLADVEVLSHYLRRPVDPNKPSPIAFEGDELSYCESTGEFIARGNVDVLQLEARRFEGDYLEGNTLTQDINIPGKSHLQQLTPGLTRVRLDGYAIKYNYGTKTGSMDSADGKVGHYYMTGKRFEFYPDKIIVYDGTQTKCGAKKPDYHLSAEKIEVYPNDRAIFHNVKFHIKGKVIFSKKRHETDIANPSENAFPRIGYNSTNGAYIRQRITLPVKNNFSADLNLLLASKVGWRSHYDIGWYNAGNSVALTYGHYSDSDDRWIKKEPALTVSHNGRIGKSAFSYGISSEYGRWNSDGIKSNHRAYGIGLAHDTIKFHGFGLDLAANYTITRESYDKSKVKGFNYSAFITKDFNDRFALYAGYRYSKNNTQNSLFNYGLDDFSKKVEAGFSYRLDERNRLAVGSAYNFEDKRWSDVDYYWFHDMHCLQLVLRYKSYPNKWHIGLEFAPW